MATDCSHSAGCHVFVLVLVIMLMLMLMLMIMLYFCCQAPLVFLSESPSGPNKHWGSLEVFEHVSLRWYLLLVRTELLFFWHMSVYLFAANLNSR